MILRHITQKFIYNNELVRMSHLLVKVGGLFFYIGFTQRIAQRFPQQN